MKHLTSAPGGFSTVEVVLIIVAVAIIGFVGWDVYHTKQTSDATLSNTNSASPSFAKKTTVKSAAVQPVAGSDNQSLQTDLNNISTVNNQDNQDLSSSSSSLNDQSTFSTLPQ